MDMEMEMEMWTSAVSSSWFPVSISLLLKALENPINAIYVLPPCYHTENDVSYNKLKFRIYF